MNEERTNYDKQMNQIYQVYTPQGTGANFTCAGWCKSKGLGPPVTGTWMGTAPQCAWSCGYLDWDGKNYVTTNPKVAYKANVNTGKMEPKYNCSACLSARTWTSYAGLNPSMSAAVNGSHSERYPRPVDDAELGGMFTDFGYHCDDPNGKVCCCDGTAYTGND